MVRFLADESVDGPIVQGLRAAGHEVTYVAELAPGLVDEDVLALAGQAHAVLITSDKDFGELVFARALPHAGVLLLRLHGLAPAEKVDRTVRAIADQGSALSQGFTVVDSRGIRHHE
jgi:predicted nuclease of predicted toxin-antitoxin system